MKKLLLSFSLFFYLISGTHAAITLVQSKDSLDSNCAASTVSSFSITLPGTVTSGNTIVGVVALENTDSQGTLTSVTDDKSNTYTLVVSGNSGGHTVSLIFFWLKNITNGPITLTANFSPSTEFIRMQVAEFSGITSTSATDGSAYQAINTGAGTDVVTSGSFVTVTSGDLVFSGTAQTSGASFNTLSTGTGYTVLYNTTSTDTTCTLASEYRIQGAAGSIAGTFSFGSGISAIYDVGAFAVTPGGGAPPPTVLRLQSMGVGQ